MTAGVRAALARAPSHLVHDEEANSSAAQGTEGRPWLPSIHGAARSHWACSSSEGVGTTQGPGLAERGVPELLAISDEGFATAPLQNIMAARQPVSARKLGALWVHNMDRQLSYWGTAVASASRPAGAAIVLPQCGPANQGETRPSVGNGGQSAPILPPGRLPCSGGGSGSTPDRNRTYAHGSGKDRSVRLFALVAG